MDTTRPYARESSHSAGVRRECKICWQVYDPAQGDPQVWQIPPGTAFADLPAHWTCPNCSATKDQFLMVCDD